MVDESVVVYENCLSTLIFSHIMKIVFVISHRKIFPVHFTLFVWFESGNVNVCVPNKFLFYLQMGEFQPKKLNYIKNRYIHI